MIIYNANKLGKLEQENSSAKGSNIKLKADLDVAKRANTAKDRKLNRCLKCLGCSQSLISCRH